MTIFVMVFFCFSNGRKEEEMIIQLNNISKSMGGTLLFSELDLKIKEGQKIGIVGRNGTGKSTLLKIIAGIELPDHGQVSIRNNQTIGYLSQERIQSQNLTGRAFLLSAKQELNHLASRLEKYEQEFAQATPERLTDMLLKYGRIQEQFEEQGGYELESAIETITNGLGITSLLNQTTEDLSGGEQTMLALAKVLVEDPAIILMDEPTNHLDAQGLAWLENYIKKSKKTVVVVTHDRHFLNQITETIVEVDFELTIYKGNYDFYRKEKEQRRLILQKDYQEQQKEIKKIKDSIRRFRQWGHEGDNEKFFKKAKELEKRLERITEIIRPPKEQVDFMKKFDFDKRSAKEVIIAKGLTKSYGTRLIFEAGDFTVFWKDKVAITGENGAGKSTLVKIILGKETATEGEVKLGNNVQVGYLSQNIRYQDPKRTVLDEFRFYSESHEEEGRRILAKYLFYKEDVFRQVGKLSGGEQVRLSLAILMQQPNNLLVLDEPTNHLDIETREFLEEVLTDYLGTLVVISHDRYFLKKITRKSISVENKRIVEKNQDSLER